MSTPFTHAHYTPEEVSRWPEPDRRALVRERLQAGACCQCFIIAPCKLCRIMTEDEAVAFADGGESAALAVIDRMDEG